MKGMQIKNILRKYAIFLILILFIIVATILSPKFVSSRNIINLLRQISVMSIVACSMQLLIISGMVDLAYGHLVALTGCVAMGVFISTQSFVAAIGAAILIGMLEGVFSGFIIAKWNLPPFIVTLASMNICNGAVLLYTGGKPIPNIGAIKVLGQGFAFGVVPWPIVFAACFLVFTWILLNMTSYGRKLYAIGGNKEAANAAGINVKKTIIANYMLCGAMVGFGGVVFMSRINAGQPASGPGIEFDAMISVILGGTSFNGGLGNITGTIAGALIVGMLDNVLNLLGVASYWQLVLKGAIIAFAIITDANSKNIKASRAS